MMDALVTLAQDGGWVFFPLMCTVVLLWWLLGARLADIWIPKGDIQAVLEDPQRYAILGDLAQKANAEKDSPLKLEAERIQFQASIQSHRTMIQTLIAIAPLLGLLGTVTGMMETFRGLGDASLFSQTGGVAGGIAQALLTTQIGLIIAAPGIIAFRIVDSMSKKTMERGLEILEWVKQ